MFCVFKHRQKHQGQYFVFKTSLKDRRLVENFDIARLVQRAGGCQELECPVCLEEMRPPVMMIIIIVIERMTIMVLKIMMVK